MEYKLKEEILKLSTSQDFEIAKLEWTFTNAFQSDGYETCLCGHYPIRNICVIKNATNNAVTEVGNCCINKFLGLRLGNLIFSSINKLKKNNTKSMNENSLIYILQKNVINQYEYGFYNNIMRKRKLSEKQLNLKVKINELFLAYTSYEHNTTALKLDKALLWFENNKKCDSVFIKSLKSNFDKYMRLTEKQLEALDRLIVNFQI